MAKKVLMTGATGYIAEQVLPAFQECFDLSLVDVKTENRHGDHVDGVITADLMNIDRSAYESLFDGVEAVVHLAYKRRSGEPIDHFYVENQNVIMAYNVLRSALEAGVGRVVMASSNHAADWYEHNLIHSRKMEMLDPYTLPLSDNFYGWAKAAYEHMGFVFANGLGGFLDASGRWKHIGDPFTGRRMGVVMVRIGAPRNLDLANYKGETANLKRYLGAYISPRDLTQLIRKAVDTPHIENEHGIPWQVVYGVSNNTRAFWSLRNAREVIGYAPEDDSEVLFANDIQRLLMGKDAQGGRVGKEGSP